MGSEMCIRDSSGCVHSEEGCSLNTTIVEGPIERHKSRLALRDTGDELTSTHSGGKLGPDRIGAQMFTKAPCVCRLEGSLSTGQSHALDASVPSRKLIAFDFRLLCGLLYFLQPTPVVLHKLSDPASFLSVGILITS